jgi:hypothetical protein
MTPTTRRTIRAGLHLAAIALAWAGLFAVCVFALVAFGG